MLGIAEGPNFPALTRTVSDWLSLRERTRALSYALIAVPIGLAIGAPLISQLILYFSWRGMFFILGGISLVWIPFWLIFFSNKPQDSHFVNQSELNNITDNKQTTLSTDEVFEKRKSMTGLWRFLFSDRTLLTNYWAFFRFGYYLFFFMNWLPTYLLHRYHLQFNSVGLFTILPWALGAAMMLGGGILCDRIYLKTNNFRTSRSWLILISQLCAGICVIPIILTHNLTIAIIFISLAVGFILSANGAYYAVNIDIAKERSI
jgi:Sugar phosphate permease